MGNSSFKDRKFFIFPKFLCRFLLISEQGYLPDLKSNSNEFVSFDSLLSQFSMDLIHKFLMGSEVDNFPKF